MAQLVEKQTTMFDAIRYGWILWSQNEQEIAKRIYSWRTKQKEAQIGALFNESDAELDKIHIE